MTTLQLRDASRRASPQLRAAPRGDKPSATLRAAARRIAATWRNDCSDGVSPEEVSELLDAIITASAGRGEDRQVDPRLQSDLGRHLLDVVRAEVIQEWCHSRQPPPAREILATLDAFESVRTAIELDWAQQFTGRLSQLDGLGLVVEVAHDLRSPLTSILFLAETLQRGLSGDVNEQQHRQLGLIYSAALALSQTTTNIIELARNRNRLADGDEPSAFSVTDILESVSNITRPMAEEKGLIIKLNPPGWDHRIGHPLPLSRVLLNLTTNALKFTEKGFVEITARETGPARIEFSVRDTGDGISPQAVETLYSPFRRAATGEGYAFSSTGLGLVLCRKLVEAMGSELRVETKPDWGTRFHFDIELHRVDHL